MNEAEKYVKKVSDGLKKINENERGEILNEIRSHIHEAVSRQEPISMDAPLLY